MKKMILTLLALLLPIIILNACTQSTLVLEEAPPDYNETLYVEDAIPLPQLASDFGLTIVRLFEENDPLLGNINTIHTLDYNQVQLARGNEPSEDGWGVSLLIQADVPLYNFSIIAVEHDFENDEWLIIPLASVGEIDLLTPNEGYLIFNYIGAGTLFLSGVTFEDENGNRHYFTMGENQSGSIEPNIWDPDVIDLFEDGELQITIVTDGRGTHYFTVTLDENGQFDPDAWIRTTRTPGHYFLVIPFQYLGG